jgi:3-deoxy-manno-octulosonate cytidylyltransferase (CMP-KDO synthetase)
LPFTPTETSVLAIIPARYQSTRFPGKPLVDLGGRPMIEHVYRRAVAARLVDHVLVATDDDRIAAAVDAFGGAALMTRSDHPSATERLAEVVGDLPCGVVVNLQGDEPLIDPMAIDAAVSALVGDASVAISSLCRPLGDGELISPHVTKVVCDLDGYALYFSRAPIPHAREGEPLGDAARAHVGLYVYRRDMLLKLAALPPSPLEQLERLEQLRALQHGVRIKVIETSHDSPGVDTPEDLERIRRRLSAGGGLAFSAGGAKV